MATSFVVAVVTLTMSIIAHCDDKARANLGICSEFQKESGRPHRIGVCGKRNSQELPAAVWYNVDMTAHIATQFARIAASARFLRRPGARYPLVHSLFAYIDSRLRLAKAIDQAAKALASFCRAAVAIDWDEEEDE